MQFTCDFNIKYVYDFMTRTDDKEIRSRVIQARKCIACLNGILWSEDVRNERKLNIYNALIKRSLL